MPLKYQRKKFWHYGIFYIYLNKYYKKNFIIIFLNNLLKIFYLKLVIIINLKIK